MLPTILLATPLRRLALGSLLMAGLGALSSRYDVTALAHAQSVPVATDRSLKDYCQAYFPIGVAVEPASLHGPEAALILQQFNSF